MGPVGMSWRTTTRHAALGAGLGLLIVLFAFASLAHAARIGVHNWPNSPVRHTPSTKVGATPPSFAANLRGGVAVAGNTLETCPANLAARARQKAHRGKTPGSRAASEPCINDYNNDLDMKYVNVDPGRSEEHTSELQSPC